MTPPYLKHGDTIGIVCPSGYMPLDKVQTAIKVLQEWGFNVIVGDTVGLQHNYFAGTDEQRINDLQKMMDDRGIHAILCARGGYGLSRIIDQLSFKTFKKHPKWIIGYSDITVLQAHLFSRYKIASLHSPMAAAFNDGEYNNEYIQSLRKTLGGEKQKYHCLSHSFNRTGDAKGRLVGGNLSLLAHLSGTRSAFNTKNKILFIEDVGEYIYNIDRMLQQLKRSGMLNKLKGLIVGSFTELKDTQIPFGQTAEEVIRDAVKEYEFPVCFNFPVGHVRENYPLKIGVEYKLSVSDRGVTLAE